MDPDAPPKLDMKADTLNQYGWRQTQELFDTAGFHQ